MQEDYKIPDAAGELRQDRKYFSGIGMMFFWGTILVIAIQGAAIFLVRWLRPEWLEDSTISLLVTSLPLYLLALPLMILLITRVKPRTVIRQNRMSAGQMAVAFLMSYAMLYVSNLLGNFITVLIGLIKGSGVGNVLVDAVFGTNPWVVFFLMVLCAPVFEEFIFRKLLIDRAVAYGEDVAVVLSGVMFGLFHGNLNQFAYAFLLGIFFGFIYVKTGKIRYTVILHMVINFMGSVVSTQVMNAINVEKTTEALQLFQSNPTEGMAALQSVLPGLIFSGIYVLLIFGVVIAGIVLLIVKRRKFRLMPGEVVIPKGKRFQTVMGNLGMALFSIFWVVQMIWQLLQPA